MRIEALRRLARRYAAEGDITGACAHLAEAADQARRASLFGLQGCLDGERLLISGDPHVALERLELALDVLTAAALPLPAGWDPGPTCERAQHLIAEATRRVAQAGAEATPTAVHICARVGTYREFARSLPVATDVVIELGRAEGHTTLHLARRARQVIAVDRAGDSLPRARERCAACSNICWLNVDGLATGPVLAAAPRADLVFIDLGGSTWPTIALRAAAVYHHLYRPRAIVVRNVGLNDFVASVTSCEGDAPQGHWRGR